MLIISEQTAHFQEGSPERKCGLPANKENADLSLSSVEAFSSCSCEFENGGKGDKI
jgi:hypothetical protein